jgi:hypothetical protein
MLKRLTSLFAHTGFVFILIAVAAIPDAAANYQPGKTLVGSWEVLITNEQGLPPAVDVTMVNRDGTMSNSDGIFGTGHGVWKHAGASQFAFKFKTPILALNILNFPPGSMLTVTGTLTVDKDGATASGPYTAVILDSAGNSLLGFDGSVFFTRISI